MNLACNDRERIFEDGTAAEWASLETHAAACASCAEELRVWKSLSTAAAELRDYEVSPSLWPRIETALAESKGKEERSEASRWRLFWRGWGVSWQTVAVGAFALLLMISGGWIYRSRIDKPVADSQSSLLKSKALSEVERAETAYVQAIERLAAEAKPQLDKPDTSLLANYHEKLLVLHSAIDDLRAQAQQNPSNAHLRHQLLAMYQEKQRTLEEVLEEKR